MHFRRPICWTHACACVDCRWLGGVDDEDRPGGRSQSKRPSFDDDANASCQGSGVRDTKQGNALTPSSQNRSPTCRISWADNGKLKKSAPAAKNFVFKKQMLVVLSKEINERVDRNSIELIA